MKHVLNIDVVYDYGDGDYDTEDGPRTINLTYKADGVVLLKALVDNIANVDEPDHVFADTPKDLTSDMYVAMLEQIEAIAHVIRECGKAQAEAEIREVFAEEFSGTDVEGLLRTIQAVLNKEKGND